jgi:hypothetical protein
MAKLAYSGPGLGLEFVPYFYGLLACAGLALAAVLLWPILAFFRWMRHSKNKMQEPSRLGP